MIKRDEPEKYYKDSLNNLKLKLKQIKGRELILSFFKIFLIIIICFFIINYKSYSIYPFLALSVSLLIISIFHESIIKKKKILIALKKVDETELNVIDGKFKELYNGNEFIDIEHNYSDDLDLFGDGSLFQYVNRATTSMGRKTLANWLLNKADILTIENRQKSVIELLKCNDFRKKIQIHGGKNEDNSTNMKKFIDFFNTPIEFTSNKLLFVMVKVVPVLTVLSLYLGFTGFPFYVFFSFFLFQLSFNLVYEKKNSAIYNLSKKSYKILKTYSKIIEEIENNEFKSSRLDYLRKKLYVNKKKASYYIKRLAILLEWFELRNSSIHFLVNNIFFWDINIVFSIEKLRAGIADSVETWLDVLGEVEVLSGFATLYYNNPDWSMPEFDKDVLLKAEHLGHPLINGDERIVNDILIENGGKIIIITGPNMAGKSTFLRTIGVNIVLAQAGAPVCCNNFLLSPVDIYTSMKISDSLDKKMSLFYAELSRLKKIIDGLKTKKKIFFLIDEMLKGTNVMDRQKGSLALMKQLIDNGANGILATHDLKLSDLEKDYKKNDKILNFHFDSYIKDDLLEFDYKLKRGVCKSFNAHILMKNMGIEV